MPKDKDRICIKCTWWESCSKHEGNCTANAKPGRAVYGAIFSAGTVLVTKPNGYCGNHTPLVSEKKNVAVGFSNKELAHLFGYFKATDTNPLDLKYPLEPEATCLNCRRANNGCQPRPRTATHLPRCANWEPQPTEKQMTIPCENSKLLCRHDRTAINESLAKLMIAIVAHQTDPPCSHCANWIPPGLLGEIGKIQEILGG